MRGTICLVRKARVCCGQQRTALQLTVWRASLEYCWCQWPRGLRLRSSAARLLRLWVRIPPGAWLFFCCECCVLSGRSLCDGLITRPEESYRIWCVVVCDQETSKTRRLKPATGLWKYNQKGCNARKTNKTILLIYLLLNRFPWPPLSMIFEWRLSRVEFRWIDLRRQYASPIYSTEIVPFLISNFRRVLNVVCFLLGDSPAFEFYMPTFRNTLSVSSS